MPHTVQLSDAAYATLAALKAPGESFSDTVNRLASTVKDPRALLRLGARRRGVDLAILRRETNEADRRKLRALFGRTPVPRRRPRG